MAIKVSSFLLRNFTSVAHFLLVFRKCAFLCRKMQNFCVVFSKGYEKSDKKVKISSKIGLTCRVVSGIILGTPTRCSSKGWAARTRNAKQAERGSFQVYWLSEALSWVARLATGYNLPGGAPERIKRGKEKVVTRAVANAEMKFSGTSERGNTALSELKWAK